MSNNPDFKLRHDENVTDLNASQDVSIAGDLNVGGNISNNYIRFLNADTTGSLDSLNEEIKNNAETETGFALTNGTITESAWTGDDAAAAITLPSANPGALTVLAFTTDADGNANMTITCASGNTFQTGSLYTDIPGSTPGNSNYHVSSNITGLAANLTTGTETSIAAGNNTFIFTATTSANQTAQGAFITFYSPDGINWRVGWRAVRLGIGSLNTPTFAFSTV